MKLCLCDRCGCVLPEDVVALEGQGGFLLCSACNEIQRSQEQFICDRCQAVFPLNALRDGEAIFVPGRDQKKGALYCKRCKSFHRRQKNEIKDIRNLVALFLFSLLIPVGIGVYGRLSKKEMGPEKEHGRDKTVEIRSLVDEIQKTFQQEIVEVKKEIQKLSRPESPSREESPSPAHGAEIEKKSAAMLLQLPDLIVQKSIENIRLKLSQGNLDEKLQSLREIAVLREEAAIPVLLEATRDNDPLVRGMAAVILSTVGAHQSVGRLVTALGDPDPVVRRCVSQSLNVLTREKFVFFQELSPIEWQRLKEMKEQSQGE